MIELKQVPDTDLWVSRDGSKIEVRKVLSSNTDSSGYHYVHVEHSYNLRVHVLVALAWIGKRPSIKHGVCHKNGDPSKNDFTNLYWGTQKQNAGDAKKHGMTTKGDKNTRAKLSNNEALELKKAISTGLYTNRNLALEFGVSEQTVCDIKSGRTWAWL